MWDASYFGQGRFPVRSDIGYNLGMELHNGSDGLRCGVSLVGRVRT